MRPPSYIGVTGFMSKQEVERVLDALPKGSARKVMVGVLMSGKTLYDIPNKYPKRYPNPRELKNIFFKHKNVLNLIHFNTKEPEHLKQDIVVMREFAGPDCHGFQFNMAWPDPKALEWNKKRQHWDNYVVLQCGAAALAEVDHVPAKLAKRLEPYEELIDYVLIDPSGGVGKDFDELEAIGYFSELRARMPELGLGIAGGLHAGNISRLERLGLYFHSFSIDAEGKLRDPETDELNAASAAQYVAVADQFFQKHEAMF